MSINVVLFHHGIFNPGGVIEGKVVCVINSSKDIRGIRLKIRGREHTSWEKRESYYDSEAKETKWKTVHYSGDNKFLEYQQNVHGGGRINQGKHEFPFSFVLPKKIPSSYDGAHGHIRYYAKANVDIPMAPDYEDEKRFTVFSPINFNEMLGSIELNPTQYQDETNLCCCCCASGPIVLEAYLTKEAFVVGETMKLKVHITNMSNESIENLNVELKRITTERCTSPSSDEKTETEILVHEVDTGVGAHGDRDYHLDLIIPSDIELPNFSTCQLFSQWCILKITATIPGCHSDIEMETGITLGHIPVASHSNMQNTYVDGTVNTISSPLAPFPSAPQPYPLENQCPPYPTGPNPFPVPSSNPGQIGFSMPGGDPYLPPPYPNSSINVNLPGIHKPNGVQAPYPPNPGASYPTGVPCPPYPSGSSSANAPCDESAPSAPSKSDLANGDDFIILDEPTNHNNEPPPPSYHDAMGTSKH